MDCFYINLAKATDRKARLEHNFDQTKQGQWALSRFNAVDVEQVRSWAVQGRLKETEKACFLSHRSIIAQQATSDAGESMLVLEDDALLGTQTFAALDEFLENSKRNHLEWDVVFTDICVPLAETMVQMIRLRSQLVASQRTQLIDLKQFVFGGATAYLVNGASINKLHQLLQSEPQLDVAYDIYLRKLIHQGALKGYCLFPFVTSLSSEAEASQIQSQGTQVTDLIWNTFRRMTWRERNVSLLDGDIQAIREACHDDEAEKFGVILGSLLSKSFVPK
jgi:GR25 family glycosyltransferase involved in LPS biosynthesis